jgi:nicotinic acid mononucleotide adenylyltransferase
LSDLILFLVISIFSSPEEARATVSVGTAALLEYLAEIDQIRGQQCEYTFCLGSDTFLDLTAGKWKESDRVLELLQGRFIVLHRTEEETQTSDTNTVRKQVEQRVANVPGAQLLTISALGAVSSSMVREAIAAGGKSSATLDGNESLVHPAVLSYIRDKGLYKETTST